jgi:hypothetical protein
MTRNPATPWPTTRGSVFFAGAASPATLSRAVTDGRIRRLSAGLYTADLTSQLADLVDRNRWEILARLIPDAVVADRSAASNGLPVNGVLFIISNQRARDLVLPGLTISPRPGHPPLIDDLPWAAGLRVTSDARTVVDNLAISRARAGRPARTMSRAEVEDWLVRKVRLRPEGWLPGFRARAIEIAGELLVPGRVQLIQEIVGAVSGTRPVRKRAGKLLSARSSGQEWDPVRIQRLDELAAYLKVPREEDGVPGALPTPQGDLDGTLPFFEAYFSNFIEGTEFTIDEAERIIRSGEIPTTRPEDAHDVLGTYRIVSDPVGRATVPMDAEQLLSLLRLRHRAVMSGRPDKRPGEFKERRNQAGSYVFVEPDLVEGTLVEGFKRSLDLRAGFPRAVFQLFLVSEVHPFDDGNGRVARAAMCSELSAVGQSRIVVPIVFRNEYLTAHRVLSREGRCNVFARTLAYVWRWTAAMPWHDRAATLGRLAATNALVDSTDAEQSGVRLDLP